jgi:hypothetical protein
MSDRSETQPKRQDNDDCCEDEKEQLDDQKDKHHYWNERVDAFPSKRLETIIEASSSSPIAPMMQGEDDVTPTNNNKNNNNKNRNRLSSSGSGSSSSTARINNKKHRPSLLPNVDSKLFLSTDESSSACEKSQLAPDEDGDTTEPAQICGIPCRLFVILVALSIAVLIGTILAVLSYKPPSPEK